MTIAMDYRHETRGPYAVRTVIEWPPLTTEGVADNVARCFDAIAADDPGELETMREELKDANERADEYESDRNKAEARADAAEAELRRARGEVCSICSRGHANNLGICGRHGKPVKGFDLAAEHMKALQRVDDLMQKHHEASREVVNLRCELEASTKPARRRKTSAA